MDNHDWQNLPTELLTVIASRVEFLADVPRFSSVCKSWNYAASTLKKVPLLLLAEHRVDFYPSLFNFRPSIIRDLLNNNVTISSSRGLFSLVTKRNYYIDLPEATDKLILGTNKGWLVTLGKDLEINLLHPLSRHQITLPPMLTLPSQYEYNDDFQPQHAYINFINKVVMSSQVTRKSAVPDDEDTSYPPPMIMVIYGEDLVLGWCRLGDKLWTNVELETSPRLFCDIVYHKEKFYAINYDGTLFMCDIVNDDNKDQQGKGNIVTSVPTEKITSVAAEKKEWEQIYLIESLSGSHIWVVLRFWKQSPKPHKVRYHTTNFLVFKLEIHDAAIQSCSWEEEIKNIGNEAFFVGLSSSTSVASSEFIKPNSIYYTDDRWDLFMDVEGGEDDCGPREGGGRDMGIFNVKTSEIQPHFQGSSVHHFSPPIWYI